MNSINSLIIFISKSLDEKEIIDFLAQIEPDFFESVTHLKNDTTQSHISFLYYLGDFTQCLIIYSPDSIVITSEQIAFQLCENFNVSVMVERASCDSDDEYITRTSQGETFFTTLYDTDGESVNVKQQENIINNVNFSQYSNIIAKSKDLVLEYDAKMEVCNVHMKSKNADLLINAPASHYAILYQLILINGAEYRRFTYEV